MHSKLSISSREINLRGRFFSCVVPYKLPNYVNKMVEDQVSTGW